MNVYWVGKNNDLQDQDFTMPQKSLVRWSTNRTIWRWYSNGSDHLQDELPSNDFCHQKSTSPK